MTWELSVRNNIHILLLEDDNISSCRLVAKFDATDKVERSHPSPKKDLKKSMKAVQSLSMLELAKNRSVNHITINLAVNEDI